MEYTKTEGDQQRYASSLSSYFAAKSDQDNRAAEDEAKADKKDDLFNAALEGTLMPVGAELSKEAIKDLVKGYLKKKVKTVGKTVSKGVDKGLEKVKSIKQSVKDMSDDLGVDPESLNDSLESLPDATVSRATNIDGIGQSLMDDVSSNPIQTSSAGDDGIFSGDGDYEDFDLGAEDLDIDDPDFFSHAIRNIYRPTRDINGKIIKEDYEPLDPDNLDATPGEDIGDALARQTKNQANVQDAVDAAAEEDEFGDPTLTSLQSARSMGQTSVLGDVRMAEDGADAFADTTSTADTSVTAAKTAATDAADAADEIEDTGAAISDASKAASTASSALETTEVVADTTAAAEGGLNPLADGAALLLGIGGLLGSIFGKHHHHAAPPPKPAFFAATQVGI
tara:strand:- start:13010 stop:14194 length:1185 start_codon:yes stop_codon:yes gene_type:complete